MSTVADLSALGFNVARPVEVARGIDELVLTRDQKAALLRRYLAETGITASALVRTAAASYGKEL